MSYRTENELMNFDFAEAVVADIQVTSGFFHVDLDNVKIKPENSCNRDIREMRANNLVLKIEQAAVVSLIEEGFKTYDAIGNLKSTCEDVEIPENERLSVIKTLAGGVLYSLEKKDSQYVFTVDAENERTYELTVEGSGDVEEWDRFLNL